MICSRANVDLKSETKDETGNLKQSVTQTPDLPQSLSLTRCWEPSSQSE